MICSCPQAQLDESFEYLPSKVKLEVMRLQAREAVEGGKMHEAAGNALYSHAFPPNYAPVCLQEHAALQQHYGPWEDDHHMPCSFLSSVYFLVFSFF